MTRDLLNLFFVSLLFSLCAAGAAFAEVRTVQMTAVEINGGKFWLAETITVKKGDTVKIHAVSRVAGAKKDEGSPHGLEIADFKVTEVVDGKGKDIEFTADKAGIFPVRCQLHP